VFSIPQALDDRLAEEFEDLESDALAETILILAEKHPEFTEETVKFCYKSGALQVSLTEPVSLFVTDDT